MPVTTKHAPESHELPSASADAMKDPVCGMTVRPPTKAGSAVHDGVTYHFCSAGCRAKFTADPQRYTRGPTKAPAASDPGTLYTCPMHLEIEQSGR